MSQTTSYTVSLRLFMDPPGLVVDIELLRQAQSFANSIISAALQSLNDYEYITGAIHVDNIDSKLHQFCQSTLPELAVGEQPTSFCGNMEVGVIIQGPPNSFIPYILADAVRSYIKTRVSIADIVHVSYRDSGLTMAYLGWHLPDSQQESGVELFEDTVVDFLNGANSNVLISSALVFDHFVSDPPDNMVTINAIVFGDVTFFSRSSYTYGLVSAFKNNPEGFLKRLMDERDFSDSLDAFEAFAIKAPIPPTPPPTLSPVIAIDPVPLRAAKIRMDASDVKVWAVSVVLFAVCVLSAALAYSICKRVILKKSLDKKSIEQLSIPETASPPV